MVVDPRARASSGYPPEDLLLKDGFVDDGDRRAGEARRGSPDVPRDRGHGRPADDRASSSSPGPVDARDVAAGPARVAAPRGSPTPRRWSAPAGSTARWRSGGCPTTACSTSSGGSRPGTGARRGLRRRGPGRRRRGLRGRLGRRGARRRARRGRRGLLVVLNASPYSRGRLAASASRCCGAGAAETGCAIAYVNLVGGQDELVFDGASLVARRRRATSLAAAPQFEADLLVARRRACPTAPRQRRALRRRSSDRPPREGAIACRRWSPSLDGRRRGLRGARTGTRDYLAKNGFALRGHRTVRRHRLVARRGASPSTPSGPTRSSACRCRRGTARRTRATTRATSRARLGIRFVVDADRAGARRARPGARPRARRRARGAHRREPAVAHPRRAAHGASRTRPARIVLTTGNKSELATGYSTLYGDSAGGFAVIKDVVKTLVYELCRHRNDVALAAARPAPIPDAVLDKPPSAELRADQLDDDSLPPYELLDPVLEAYVEEDRTVDELVAEGHDRDARRARRRPRRRRGVQAAPDAAGRAHHVEVVRQGPPPAHHQPLRRGHRRRDEPPHRTRSRGRAAHCRVFRALFATCGAAGTSAVEGRAGARRRCSTSLAGQFAWHAELLFDLLPTRAGIDASALVRGAAPAPTTRSARSTTARGDGEGAASHRRRSPAWWCRGCSRRVRTARERVRRALDGPRARALTLIVRDLARRARRARAARSSGRWRPAVPGRRRRRRRRSSARSSRRASTAGSLGATRLEGLTAPVE